MRVVGEATERRLLLVAALGMAAVGAGTASAQKTATVRYAPGGPGNDGYSSASVTVKYSLMSCDGELWISMGAEPSTLSRSSTYWYQGKQYPVPAIQVDYSSLHVMFVG